MIIKHIPTPARGRGFERLAEYVLDVKKRGIDPASWERLSAYVIDAAHDGAKVGWTRVSGCLSRDPGFATKEILAVQAMNTRSQSDKNFHLVISFQPGETPTREQIEDIEDRVCEVLGFSDHQRVGAAHVNTVCLHYHIAVNKVNPKTFRNVTPYFDKFKLQAIGAELEVKHGLQRTPHTVDFSRAGKHCDPNSFASWIRERAREALIKTKESARGWPELHDTAAGFDLVLKPRGAGLVIAHRGDNRLHVKASEVDRALSMKAVTDKFGPYEPPATEPAKPAESYVRRGMSGPLYERFSGEREAALAVRKAAEQEMRARHLEHAGRLKAFYRERFAREHLTGQRGILRRESFRALAGQRREAEVERKAREILERRQLREAYRVPTWQAWLEAEACSGDEAALAALRSRQKRAERIEAQVLRAENAAEARHVVRRHLRPAIRRDGRVIYTLNDGGLVSDEAEQVRVTRQTAAATFLALELAADRFGARALVVRGTDEFQRQVAELAGSAGLGVTFADAAQERKRLAAVRALGKENRREHGHDLER